MEHISYDNGCLTLFPTKTSYFSRKKGFFLRGISFSSSGEEANIDVSQRFGFGLPKHRFSRTTELYWNPVSAELPNRNRNFGRTLWVMGWCEKGWRENRWIQIIIFKSTTLCQVNGVNDWCQNHVNIKIKADESNLILFCVPNNGDILCCLCQALVLSDHTNHLCLRSCYWHHQ